MPTPKPWYKQFWPWFLIVLPGSAVVASFASLYIALDNADTLVRDDWYQHGVTINDELEREDEAARRGIRAALALDPSGRTVTATFDGPDLGIEALKLTLHHPTFAQRDIDLVLSSSGPNRFVAAADRRLDGTWDVTLAPDENDWQIKRRVWLTPMKAAAVEPLPATNGTES